eukprot:1186913-Prorocentrum_minimum.AAC.2
MLSSFYTASTLQPYRSRRRCYLASTLLLHYNPTEHRRCGNRPSKSPGCARALVDGCYGEADAERIRAEGSRQAADLLAEAPLAVELARIERTGAAIAGGKASLFFGADPKRIENLFANPSVINLHDH